MQPGEVPSSSGPGRSGCRPLPRWPAAASNRSSCRTTSPTAASWPVIASARTSPSIPPKGHRSTRCARFAPNADCRVRCRLRMRRRRRTHPEHRRIRRNGHPDLLRGRLVQRRYPRHHRRHPSGRHHPIRRWPTPTGLVRNARRDRAGRLDPLPSVGEIIGLDEVPAALDLARKSDGPPRIVVHPNGDVR